MGGDVWPIHAYAQKLFIETLLYFMHSSRYWRYHREEARQPLCLTASYSLLRTIRLWATKPPLRFQQGNAFVHLKIFQLEEF